MTEKKSGKDARGGPMRIVYAVILVGIVAIVAIAFFTGHGPGDEAPVAVQPAN